MLNIALTIPSLSVPHGGIRIIVEWANQLCRNHNVMLFCRKGVQEPSWIDILPQVELTSDLKRIRNYDALIICSPHDIDLCWILETPPKKFIFLQMLEHLFRPGDQAWMAQCNKAYGSRFPTFVISKWNEEYIRRHFRYRIGELHYIGNGVNFNNFPIQDSKKDGKTVLIEGWEAGNPTKDYRGIAPMAAEQLRAAGYKILAYGHLPIKRYDHVPHEYYFRPSLSTLNELYSKATILIKASRYDARACAPMEAMTKGCVTVRAINSGDDDLIDGVNCVRIPYSDEKELATAALSLLSDTNRLTELRQGCYDHVKQYSWDYWMPRIERILTHD